MVCVANVYGTIQGGWYLVYNGREYFVERSEFIRLFTCVSNENLQRIRESGRFYDQLRTKLAEM